MKKLFITLALVGCLKAYGQADLVYLTNNMSSGIATISTAPGILENVIAYTTNTTPSFLYFYDGYYLATNAAWTNYSQYVTNVAVTYITTTGITNSMTNTVIATAPLTHAGGTGIVNTASITLIVPGASSAGTVNRLTVNPALIYGKALSISNSGTGLTLISTYRNQ